MSAPRTLPGFVRRLLWGLLPGQRGTEVIDELEREAARIRERSGDAAAWLWGALQLVRPQTWILALELRGQAGRADGVSGFASGFGFSMVDLKLGVRMLMKHPGVTLVVVFALGIGIPVSLAPHVFIDAAFDTSLPFEDGDDIVALMIADPVNASQQRPRIDQYELWREELTTVVAVGAAMPQVMNLIGLDERPAPVPGAMISASSFVLTRVPPMLGRTLDSADEEQGAPDVAVIGYNLWQSRFGADAGVVGSTVGVAGRVTTIVGVMPEGFGFPGSEQIWTPLRSRAIDFAPGDGPRVMAYGRLASDASMRGAQAEIEVVTRRAVIAEDERETVVGRPEIAHFSALSFGTPKGMMWRIMALVQVFPVFLLLIACGNVAVLMMARAANRTGEFAIRTALGAGRGRVVSQLFVETLVLATVATGVGLLLLHFALTRIDPLLGGPFWLEVGVTPEVAAKAFGLAIFSAVVAGVFPAVKATGRNLQGVLQRSGGPAGVFRFGRLADALIVMEVALGVGALFGGVMAYKMFAPGGYEHLTVVEPNRYLVASVVVPRLDEGGTPTEAESARHRERVASDHYELRRRLLAEPGVRAISIADSPPGSGSGERRARFADDEFPADFGGSPIVVSFVDAEFFSTIDIAPTRGRSFQAGDVPLEEGTLPASVIVNQKFLDRHGETDGVGKILRLELDPGGVDEDTPVFEIIGVVPEIEPNAANYVFDGTPMAYLPAVAGTLAPFTVVLDLGESPEAFAPRFRRIVADTDPAAIVRSVGRLDDPSAGARVGSWALMGLGGLAGIAIVLSCTALYALMSFTVARRTREIGIRTALGGSTTRIMRTVARRAVLQLGIGIGFGSGFWVLVLRWQTGGWGGGSDGSGDIVTSTVGWPIVLGITVLAVLAVGLLACLGPTLRGLRIRPVEALSAD